MQRAPVVVLVCLWILVAATGRADEQASEIAQLKELVRQLSERVALLEAGGDPDRAREIAEIETLLESVRVRIEALESEASPPPESEAHPELVGEPESPLPPVAPSMKTDAPIRFYGSLRVRSLIGESGDVELIDRFSRVGFAAEHPMREGWSVLGRFEAGMNLVNQNPSFVIGGDPGFAYGEGSEPFTTRIGFVGFDTPYGSVSWGKQWGVYYDIAQWTDEFYTFGGEGSGAYAQGDGGINGTGRAETALQYRFTIGPVELGLQAQNRSRTSRDRKYGDTVGASLRWAITEGLTAGIAYNEVRDGVSDPGPNEPHLGDRALIIGARWARGRWLLAATLHEGQQRELDDEGEFFDNRGAELFVLHTLGERWSVQGGANWLEPDDPSYEGEFRRRNFLAGVAYHVTPVVVISGEARLENSRTASGESLGDSVLALGINVGW